MSLITSTFAVFTCMILFSEAHMPEDVDDDEKSLRQAMILVKLLRSEYMKRFEDASTMTVVDESNATCAATEPAEYTTDSITHETNVTSTPLSSTNINGIDNSELSPRIGPRQNWLPVDLYNDTFPPYQSIHEQYRASPLPLLHPFARRFMRPYRIMRVPLYNYYNDYGSAAPTNYRRFWNEGPQANVQNKGATRQHKLNETISVAHDSSTARAEAHPYVPKSKVTMKTAKVSSDKPTTTMTPTATSRKSARTAHTVHTARIAHNARIAKLKRPRKTLSQFLLRRGIKLKDKLKLSKPKLREKHNLTKLHVDEHHTTRRLKDTIMHEIESEIVREFGRNGINVRSKPETTPPVVELTTLKVFLAKSSRLPIPLSENNAYCFLNPESVMCRVNI